MNRYKLTVESCSNGLWKYTVSNPTVAIRWSEGFSDEESARQFGQRAMYCLNKDFTDWSKSPCVLLNPNAISQAISDTIWRINK